MAVKRYDGSQWVTVAGKGDQGTSSSISTWVKTASGGETSLSGNDDNSQSLSYTVGQELVFINGTLLKRGSDYTATNGTSITGLTALAANDVATVWTVNAFSVTNAISNTLVDAKGDILIGTGADTPGRLAVGTDGQVLSAASTTSTGLSWTTLSSPALTKITSADFTTQSSVTIDNIFSSTYKHYMAVFEFTGSTSLQLRMQFRYSSSTENGAQYYGSNFEYSRGNAASGNGFVGTTYATILNTLETTPAQLTMYFSGVGGTNDSSGETRAAFWMNGFNSGDSQSSILGGGRVYVNRTYTGIIFTTDTGTITGSYKIYGLAN